MNPYSVSESAPQEETPVPSGDSAFAVCPRCGEPMEPCFTGASRLWYLTCAGILKVFLNGHTVSRRPLLDRLMDFWGRFFCSYRCQVCGCFVIDSKAEVTIHEARKIAAERLFIR